MCEASAERNLYVDEVLPSVSCAVWEFQTLNWVFSPYFSAHVGRFGLSGFALLFALQLFRLQAWTLWQHPAADLCNQSHKGFPVSADTGLGSGHCLRQGKWFFTQLALMISFRWLFLSGRQSTHDKAPLFMGWSRAESLCGLESVWREKSCREFCCAFVLWGEESDKGEVDVEEHWWIKCHLWKSALSSCTLGQRTLSSVGWMATLKWRREHRACSSLLIIHRTQKHCILTTD